MASNYTHVQRLLIADEVGLGKTIEVGLILRDYLLRNNDLSCLYLTRGGLRPDVKSKLGSVIGTDGLIDIITSFRSYGEAGAKGIQGIRIGSIEAARRYATKKDGLPDQNEVAPDIVIIDECHYCAAKDDNLQPENLKAGDATQAYTMAYQMINGGYWPNSKPPQLVILMSATPFRSETQFLNLLKLLSHGTTYVSDAYHNDSTPEKLIKAITRTDSPITVVWRQQDQVRNWAGNRFFPNLRIIRPHQAINEDEVIRLEDVSTQYVELLTTIKETFQQYTKDNGRGFGGFAVRQLEQRLTSSSIAGACYIFRWCIQHAPWTTQEQYKADNSSSTNGIRDLIRAISKSLAAFDEDGKANFSAVNFASDDFEFLPAHLQDGNIPQIAKYKTTLREAGNSFVAMPEQLHDLASLGLQLLSFSSPDQPGVENTKLNWLKKMLDRHPNDKFLIFAESLQTCAVIASALGKRCGTLLGTMPTVERGNVTKQFCDTKSPMQALIATSCADEGFDFQVANHIVHWDLHPSPATLMQRNGRLARLGQVADVTAYYLIVQGTHEERREQALIDRFADLNITDEALKLKILGQLDEDQEIALSNAIEKKDLDMVGELLKEAIKSDNLMSEKFQTINKDIKCRYALDRKGLFQRLKLWKNLGFPAEFLDLKISKVEWPRPLFTEQGVLVELTNTDVIGIIEEDYGHGHKTLGKLVFDPEFKVFGGDLHQSYRLAGLLPWRARERAADTKIRPLDKERDPISYLALKLSRQSKSDFAVIKRSKWLEDQSAAQFHNASYLLITTHPIKEMEGVDFNQGYLSFFAFDADCQQPINIDGASAEATHKLISILEEYTSDSASYETLRTTLTNNSKHLVEVGKRMADWLNTSRKYGGGFLVADEFFMPIPVALIAIMD